MEDVANIRQRSTVKNSRISFADMAHESIVLQSDSALSNHESVYSKNDGVQEMTPCDTENRSAGDYNIFPSASRKKSGANCRDTVNTFRFPGYLRLLACLAMAVIATILFEFILTDFSVTFQTPLLLAMQSFCFVCLFFILAIYLRNTWTNENICVTFGICVAVEFLIGYGMAQNKLDSGTVQPVFTFVVLICVGGVSMYSSQDIVLSALVITGISIVRFLACTMITDLPRWLRPVLVYCSGAIGVLAARYAAVALRSVTTSDSSALDKRGYENNVSANHTVYGKVQPCFATRRISLPNLMRKNAVSSSSSVSIESTMLMKADGLLTDIIADPSVPRQILRGLRAVQTLLKQSSPSPGSTHLRSKSSPLVSLSSLNAFASSQAYSDLPYTDDYIHFYSNKSLHRSLPSAFGRCRSVGSWTTTTSATGMPSLESSELLHRTKNWSAGGDERTAADAPQPPQHQQQQPGEMWPMDRCSSSECDSEVAEGGGRHVHGDDDAMANFSIDGEQDLQGQEDVGAGSLKSLGAGSVAVAAPAGTKHHHITFADSTKNGECNNESKTIDIFDELENDVLLDINLLRRWNYPIFDFAAKAPDTILCRVAYKIFSSLGFFETFSIPVQEFLNYFHSLELGYHNNPYHNRIHATDVLHAVFYMTVQSIPGFHQITPDDDYKSTDDTESENVFPPVSSDVNDGANETETCMRQNFLSLELMALYTAAAMHDYDHPGRTNAFLVSTCNPLAVLYNNRSVLENHHASAGWRLLLSSPRFAWLVNLNDAQFKRFRFLVIEAVLATDLARHFDLLAEFNAKANDDDAAGIDWSLEADRQMVSNMVIKMADINGPCKPRDLHTQWTERISEEFYEQGDEEAGLGLVISPYMNRHQPQLAKLQESFITHLVAPLCNSIAGAGLLPGQQTDDNEEEEEEEDVLSPVDSNKVSFDGQLSNVDFVCPMIQNLETNHQMWVKLINVETVQQEEAEHRAVESNIPPCDDEKPVNEDSGAAD